MGRVTRTVPAQDMTSVVRLITSVARQIGWNPSYVNVAEGRVVAYRAYSVRLFERDTYGRVREECVSAGSSNGTPLERCRPATRGEGPADFTLEIDVRPGGSGRFKLQVKGGSPGGVGGPSRKEIVDAFVRALDGALSRR